LKWTQYIPFGIEEHAMPEAPSDIDYTVDMGRHETMFRANTPKGEEFLGGGDLTMSNEGCPRSRADGQIVFLTASKTDPAPRYWSKGEVMDTRGHGFNS
jgi:hypothetical protein